ncbi:MAG: S-layer homology domain-containing protein [Clostridia bacterium]|nr:S-layer homology domain-containing protein [Clostridia bacterium]
MKKLISLIIAVTLVITVFPAAMPVFAQEDYTVHFFSTVDNDSKLSSKFKNYNGKAPYMHDTDAFADVFGMGETIRFDVVQIDENTKERGGVKLQFDTAVANAENTYAEVEFDFCRIFPSGGSAAQVKLTLNGNSFIQILGGKLGVENSVSNNSNIGSFANSTDMQRCKITLKTVDVDGKQTWQLISFKADGVEKIKNDAVYTSKTAAELSYMNIRYGDSNSGNITYIDNVSVTSYISEDGVSPIPDKYSLLNAAKTAKETAEASYDNAEISDGFYASINEKIDNAMAVLQDGESTSSEYAGAMTSMNSVSSMITASKNMKESGDSYYIDYENSVFDGDITSDAAVNVSIPVYTAVSENNTSLKALGFVYEDDADLATPKLVDVVPATEEISADSAGKISVPLDLSAYEDPSVLSAKIVVVEDYDEIADAAPANYIETKEDAPVGEGYSFVGDVSVSKVILNDDPDTEDFKVVYALTGTKGNAVSLLVLKPDSDIANISSDPESVIEYYNTAVFDENGKAVFEFAPKTMDYYTYIINAEGAAAYEDKVFYASLGDIDDIITKVYTDKTLDTLTSVEKDAASLNSPIIKAADEAGVDVDSVLEETLKEKTYDARTLSDFTASLYNKLNIVTLFRTADSSDTVMTLIDTYGSDIDKISDITGLSSSEKQTAYTYLLNNKSSIDDMASLNDKVSDAADKADEPKTTSKPKNSGGGSGGIVISPIVTQPVEEEKEPTVMQQTAAQFTDLGSVSWAQPAIVEFAANGWVNGKSEGIFAPGDSITREEFVKMAVNVFGFYDADAQCVFADTAEDAWHYDYIASAASKGIINGISDSEFGVGSTITRQDMAVIIYRIAKLCGLQLTEDGEYLPFADEIHISEYAFEAVTELTKSGIINGAGNNSFLPAGLATRAEAVKMLYGAYSLK